MHVVFRPRRWLALPMLALLSACAGAPGIPDTTYFRVPEPAPSMPFDAPLTAQPVVVETLMADGLHSDQALIYSLDPQARRLRAYHYQMWVDPPTRMLQRRLIASLRTRGVSAHVTDRLPVQAGALRVNARIGAFERVRTRDGWAVSVALAIRVDAGRDALPLLERDYREWRAADGDSVLDAVAAIGVALDRIEAAFVQDLAEALARG